MSTANGSPAEPAERREGTGRAGGGGGVGEQRTTTTEGDPPPHRLGQGRRGWGEGSHLQLYPTGQRRVNDGGRAGCPGQEAPKAGREKAVLVRVHHHHRQSPPPPPGPPTTTRAARAAAQSREEEASHTERRGPKKKPKKNQNGQPHPDCTEGGGGGHGDQLGGPGVAEEGEGRSWWLALGEGTGEGQAGESGGRRGCSSPWSACPWGARGGGGQEE